MNNAGNSTHKARAVDPRIFRDAATGVGQTLAASVQTGERRAQRAIDCAPAAQRACADPSYPAPQRSCSGDWLPDGDMAMQQAQPMVVIRNGRPAMQSPMPLTRAGK